MMKKQSFLSGSLILIASAALSKVIGAIFRIPLANMLGGEGMGYFSSAYGIFLTVYAVSVTGLPVAASKLTAERVLNGDEKGAARVRSSALMLCGISGAAFMLLMLLLAYPFCVYIGKSPLSVLAAAAITPSVLFSCITAVLRGCAEGRKNMYPTAISQVVEAVVKLISGLALCKAVLNQPPHFFEEAAKLMRKMPLNAFANISADEIIMPLAAAGAISGVTLSSAAGLLFMLVSSEKVKPSVRALPDRAVAGELATVIIPVALGSLVTNLTSLIDLATIIGCLKKAVLAEPTLLKGLNISAEAIPNYIFGCFSGMAVTVFNLVPSFTNMFGKGAVPYAAESFAENNIPLMRKSVMQVVFTAGFVAVPAGLGISALAPQILSLLFPSRPNEVGIAAMSLRILGIGVIFLSVSSVLFSIMQSAGRGDIPVKITAVGAAVKLVLNHILIPIPFINVLGAAFATDVCYFVVFLLSIFFTIRLAHIQKRDIIILLLKLVFCGLICAATAFLAQNFMEKYTASPLTLFISVPIGAFFYIISTHFTGILSKTTLKMLIC